LVDCPVRVTVFLDNSDRARSAVQHMPTGLRGLFNVIPSDVEVGLLTLARQPRWIVDYTSNRTKAGFRGVDKQAKLDMSPGPGLTPIVERNGSGKSSFPEALALLLTGENKRWADRSKAWNEGWRNLHADDACAIEASLSVEGSDKTMVRRVRDAGADLALADAVVQPRGKPRTPFDAIG